VLIWFLLESESPPVRGGYHELRVQYVQRMPIPKGLNEDDRLSNLARAAQSAAAERLALQTAVTRRIPDLCSSERREQDGSVKLGRKLESWWKLDFPLFRAEIVKRFKSDIPLAERSEWEDWLAASRRGIDTHSATIAAAEREIDAIVYCLFGLTDVEIELLDANS